MLNKYAVSFKSICCHKCGGVSPGLLYCTVQNNNALFFYILYCNSCFLISTVSSVIVINENCI